MGSLSSLTSIINQYGLAAVLSGGGSAASGLTATGGIISDYEDSGTFYRAHIFTSSGTFDVSALGSFGDTIEYLVVAGGGGAGLSGTSDRSGGGGAGGFRTNLSGHPLAGSAFPVSTSPGSYTVTVGGGGVGAQGTGPTSGGSNQNGSPSVFGPITSTGGGGGGSGHGTTFVVGDGAPGGSGGGGGYLGPAAGGSPPFNRPGGNGNDPATSPAQGTGGGAGQGGGGGGAGGAGSSGPNGAGGAGSPIAIETATAKTYAAGGKGGDSPPSSAGEHATGDGGDTVFNGNGYSGGSGIVVVRYQIGQLTAAAKATGGVVSFYGSKTIHVFTSSGDFNNTTGSPLTVEYVMVGGGGGGGHYVGGGGGAGGFITGPSVVGPGPNAVVIGAGGRGAYHAPYPSTATERGDQGVDTTFNSLTAGGGGGGGSGYTGSYLPGGSVPLGSGGGGSYTSGAGGTGGPQGNNGAAGVPGSFEHRGGGGGGSGQAGQPVGSGPPYLGSPGGYGTQAPSTFRDPKASYGDPGTYGGGTAPTPGGFWFAAGGGGASDSPGARTGGKGGSGGGGKGGGTASGGTDLSYGGQENTGGGGGGTDINLIGYGEPNTAPSGGSGIVIIAYPS